MECLGPRCRPSWGPSQASEPCEGVVLDLVLYNKGRNSEGVSPIVHFVLSDPVARDSLTKPRRGRQEFGSERSVALLAISARDSDEGGGRVSTAQVFEQGAAEGEANLLRALLGGEECWTPTILAVHHGIEELSCSEVFEPHACQRWYSEGVGKGRIRR